MAKVLLGMGSNIDPENNLLLAAAALRSEFGEIAFSSVYRSAAIGMDSDDFLNACCVLHSNLAMPELRQRMKALEDVQGRDRSHGSWKPRTIDLDVLMVDDRVMDDALYQYAHAYVPAIELVALDEPRFDAQTLTPVALRL